MIDARFCVLSELNELEVASGRPLSAGLREIMERSIPPVRYLVRGRVANLPQRVFPRGVPGDRFEREADSAASTVIAAYCGGSSATGRRKHDLSDVRIHKDRLAAAATRKLGVAAFAYGRHVVIDPDLDISSTEDELGLLAHELTHVLQQRGKGRIIQCAECVDSYAPGTLTDTTKKLNKLINDELKKLRGGTPTAKSVVDGLFAKWGQNDWIKKNKSKIELEIDGWTAGTEIFTPNPASTKYGTTWLAGLPATWMWLSPTLKLNKILVGSDKVGHFFQQGYDLYNRKKTKKKDRDDISNAQERGHFGMNAGGPLGGGVYSNADMAANEAGYKFYTDLANAHMKFTFDIAKYVSTKWNETSNPSFYRSDLAPAVWRGLLAGQWKAKFTAASGDTYEGTVLMRVTATRKITADIKLKDKGKNAKTGDIKKAFFTAVNHASLTDLTGTRKAVRGATIKIDEGWFLGKKCKGNWTSTGERKLTGAWTTGGKKFGSWTLTR